MESHGRELMLGSNWVTHSEPRARIRIRASESGWIDLSRLQLQAALVSGNTLTDILPATFVTKILALNTIELVVGNAGSNRRVTAPASVFSPYRQQCAIQLGKIRLETGGTVDIHLEVNRSDRGSHYVYSAAAPFLPENRRSFQQPQQLGRRSFVGSGPSRPHLDTLLGAFVRRYTSTIEFVAEGVTDLNSLQISASRGRLKGEHPGREALSNIVLDSILLPTRQQLLIGDSEGQSPGDRRSFAPAAVFSDQERRFDWFEFGFLEVSARSTIELGFSVYHPQFSEQEDDSFSTQEDDSSPELQIVSGVQFYRTRR